MSDIINSFQIKTLTKNPADKTISLPNVNTDSISNTIQQDMDESSATLELSQEGKKAAQQNQDYQMYQQMMDEMQKQNEKAKENPDDTWKILEIARRISRGDRVPPNDERKLMEANFKLYQVAKSASTLNMHKKHKKYKSMYDEENTLTDEMKKQLEMLHKENDSSNISNNESGINID